MRRILRIGDTAPAKPAVVVATKKPPRIPPWKTLQGWDDAKTRKVASAHGLDADGNLMSLKGQLNRLREGA